MTKNKCKIKSEYSRKRYEERQKEKAIKHQRRLKIKRIDLE